MKRNIRLSHEFVDYVPSELEDGKIYISILCATAIHKCCCGCGNQVVTPLSPTDWQLLFDGESISLDPSIGNWNFPCKSHYWIRQNRVEWAPTWTDKEIAQGRASTQFAKQGHYNRSAPAGALEPIATPTSKSQETRWSLIKARFKKLFSG